MKTMTQTVSRRVVKGSSIKNGQEVDLNFLKARDCITNGRLVTGTLTKHTLMTLVTPDTSIPELEKNTCPLLHEK